MTVTLTDEQRTPLEDLITAATMIAAYRDHITPYGLLSEVSQRASEALLRAEFDQAERERNGGAIADE